MIKRYVIVNGAGRSTVALMSEQKIKELSRTMADVTGQVHEVFDEDDTSVKFTFVPGVQSFDDPVYSGGHEDEDCQEEA